MSDSNNKRLQRRMLEKKLGEFLGFEDESLTDILDHLLGIETQDDLLDYVAQLLGTKDDQIKLFVQDIGRFQNGQPIEGIVDIGSEGGTATEQSPTPAPTQQKTTPKPAAGAASKAKQQPASQNNQSKNSKANTSKAVASSETTKNASNNSKKQVPGKNQKTKDSHKQPPPPETATIVPEAPAPPPKPRGLPPKGQATRQCGCFGTLHRPLTNCLFCGRISCEEEGYQFCPFPSCGYLLEEVKPPEGESPDRYVLYAVYCWNCLYHCTAHRSMARLLYIVANSFIVLVAKTHTYIHNYLLPHCHDTLLTII